MYKVTMLFLLLGIAPLIIGVPWIRAIKVKYTILFAYGIGFFSELALFHIVAFLLTIFHARFHILVEVFSILLSVICLVSLIYAYKHGLLNFVSNIRTWRKLQWYEWILLIAFILSLSLQVYRGFTYDLTYMTWDDAVYTVRANDAIATDYIGVTDPYTGLATSLDIQRAIQTSLYFPAYLTAVSGISITTMEHTVQYVQLLLLAYIIYAFLSAALFEKRENRLIFLVLVSVFYIFGYHSHYSLTFRLLGPNYQGKAVLAVSLTPLVLSILIYALKEPYKWQIGFLLLFLSIAAISLTLWGTGTILVIVTMPIGLSLFRKNKDWKHLLYIPWSVVVPVLFVTIYSVNK